MTADTPLELTASDGVRLNALIRRAAGPRGVAVICHPHPDYGGSMDLPFVELVASTLAGGGFTTLRFDFRRPGTVDERRLDLAAAVDALDVGPVLLTGWSYGAELALWQAADDARVAGVAAVAPPLRMVPEAALDALSARRIPTLLLAPEHDQYCPPDAARERARGLPVEALAGADHFLAGAEAQAARRILDLAATLV